MPKYRTHDDVREIRDRRNIFIAFEMLKFRSTPASKIRGAIKSRQIELGRSKGFYGAHPEKSVARIERRYVKQASFRMTCEKIYEYRKKIFGKA